MKSQHVSKVDLSLDDIIKMDGLNQPQDQNRGGNNPNRMGNHQNRGGNNQNRGGNNQNRGGNNQNRGNNNRGLMNQRNNGQGQRGFRPSGQQGGGGGSQGFKGVSPLNRGKVSGMTMMARRGQMTGGSGQRGNPGTWSGKYGGGGGGGGKWGGQGNNSGWTNNMTRQTNNRQFNSPRPDRTGQGGNPMYQRGHQGKFTQGSVQQWGRQNMGGGGGRQGQGNMRAGNTSNHHQGGQGQGRVMGQGDLRITVDHQQADLQGQGQPRQGLKDMTFDQKRRKAMQALREARKTIAQLDQQSAREQMVNTRRGIAPQSPSSSYQTTHDDRYGGTISDFSESSSSSESDMEDQPIMSFKMASPASRSSSSSSRHKRWQHKSSEGSHCDSTLTISIDNSAPFVSHSETAPTKNPIPLSPHSSHGTLHRSKQHWGPSPRRKKQHYHQQPEDDIPHTHSPQSPPDSQHFHPRQHNSHPHWHPREEARLVDTVDMRRGATPGFSQQLAHLKPSVAMRYAFQKKTFSAASTPVSLNDRFSEPDDPAGRKVFM